MIRIHANYQGKGLCSPFVEAILQEIKKRLHSEYNINAIFQNIGGPAGFHCYKKAANRLGYQYKCDDEIPPKLPEECASMHFLLDQKIGER